MEPVKMSEYTALINKQGDQIDDICVGMRNINKAYMNHPDENISQSAIRLDILLSNTYGDIEDLPILESVVSAENLAQELTGNYSEDAKVVKIDDFAVRLIACVKKIRELTETRNDESAKKDDTVMRDLRKFIDTDYREMAERTNAVALLDPTPEIELFIKTQNEIIKKHGGRSASAGNSDDPATPNTPVETPTEPETPAEDKYPDAIEWVEGFGVANATDGMIFYIMVDGEKVFYKLLDRAAVGFAPGGTKYQELWEKLS
jgi:hypothetical protein